MKDAILISGMAIYAALLLSYVYVVIFKVGGRK